MQIAKNYGKKYIEITRKVDERFYAIYRIKITPDGPEHQKQIQKEKGRLRREFKGDKLYSPKNKDNSAHL